MSIKETLFSHNLVDGFSRCQGRTQALIDFVTQQAKNNPGQLYVIYAHNAVFAGKIKEKIPLKNVEVLSVSSSSDRLRGTRPIIFYDHAAIFYLFHEAARELENKDRKFSEIKNKLSSILKEL